MGGASSRVNNNIDNRTINRSDLELLNSVVNKYVSSVVVNLTTQCSASSTTYTENSIGKTIIIGNKNTTNINIDTSQTVHVTLQCLQQALQQSNIANDIIQSIMTNLLQTIDNNQLTKVMSESSATNEQGFLASPFAKADSSININSSTVQDTETTRKIQNLISNTVNNSLNVDDIKNCFITTTKMLSNKVGNIKVVGESNTVDINISTKQLEESFAVCQQLTEQTSGITNSLCAQMGIRIQDDTTNKMVTDIKATSSASAKSTGVEGLISALGDALQRMLASIIGSAVTVTIIVIALIFVMKMKKGKVQLNQDGTADFNFGSSGTYVWGKGKAEKNRRKQEIKEQKHQLKLQQLTQKSKKK